nr:EOG090X091L [Eurycercus lamellatus]
MFYEDHPKSGYQNSKSKKPLPPRTERIREGLKELKNEIKIWKNEVVDGLHLDPIMTLPLPGEVDLQWIFNSSTNLNDWISTCDQDHGEGFSSCSLSLSPAGKGLFSGTLNTQVPKDGKIKASGYCNMRSMRPMKSFKRDSFHDWTMYNHLVLRVRGDGRSYMLNLASAGYFDIHWNDMHQFPLYTRGGPHWQISRIPFSRFFMSSRGRIQDKQFQVPLDRITSFGITAADKINAPFRLEIDYIGLEYDPSHKEETAYETYRMPNPYFAGY